MKILILLLVVIAVALIAAPVLRDRERRTLNEAERARIGGACTKLSDGVVHYELGGPEDGPPVVLVHGFSTPFYGFDPTFKAVVEAGHRVLRYDHFGRGYSDRPNRDYNLDLFDRQLHELVDELQIPKPFALMGWSMGGMISAEYARRHPDAVSKLILMDTAGFPVEFPVSAKLILIPGIGDYLFRVIGDKEMIAGCDTNFHEPRKFPEFTEKFQEQLVYKGYKRAIVSTMRHMPMGDHAEAFEIAGQHDRPVLVIWGKEDVVTPYENHKAVLKAMPNATLLAVEAAGHGPHYEKPEVVNPVLIDFLADPHQT